jgi:hypothetical protein
LKSCFYFHLRNGGRRWIVCIISFLMRTHQRVAAVQTPSVHTPAICMSSPPCTFAEAYLYAVLSIRLNPPYPKHVIPFLAKSQTQPIQTQTPPTPPPPHNTKLEILLLATRRPSSYIPLLGSKHIPKPLRTAITPPSSPRTRNIPPSLLLSG